LTRNATVELSVRVPAEVEESADDLMGDGIEIAARLRGIAKPSAICLSMEARQQVHA
jgi:class 3 adenylate cyclase